MYVGRKLEKAAIKEWLANKAETAGRLWWHLNFVTYFFIARARGSLKRGF